LPIDDEFCSTLSEVQSKNNNVSLIYLASETGQLDVVGGLLAKELNIEATNTRGLNSLILGKLKSFSFKLI
jgi:hypothetical protein